MGIGLSLGFLAVFNVQQVIGVSYFAMQAKSFPCEEALSVFRGVEVPATAVLWGTFGSERTCLKKYLKLGQRRILEIHPTNEAGRRNRRSQIGDLLPGYTVEQLNRALERGSRTVILAFKRRVSRIDSFLKRYADYTTEAILSTGLEDNYTEKAFRRVLGIVKQYGYAVARSKVGHSRSDGVDFNEYHGVLTSAPAPCIFNFDGTDIRTDLGRWGYSNSVSLSRAKELLRKARKCRVAFLWEASAQGIEGERFIKPRERSFRTSRKGRRIFNSIIRRGI